MTEDLRRLVMMDFGSTVYGTSLPTSDRDYKSIYMPSSREILLGTYKKVISDTTKSNPHTKSTQDDVEVETFSIKEYFRLLLEGQTVALTMLFMPKHHIYTTSAEWDFIQEEKDIFLHSGVNAFVGYCRTQANKYGIKGSRVAAARLARDYLQELIDKHGHLTKLRDVYGDIVAKISGHDHIQFLELAMEHQPGVVVRMIEVCNRKMQEHITLKEAYNMMDRVFQGYGARALQAETDQNVDWKACMHAVRVGKESIELLTTGHITYPRPEASLLLQIRKGELPYAQVADMIEEVLDTINNTESTLPKTPNTQAVEDLLHCWLGQEVVRNFMPTGEPV